MASGNPTATHGGNFAAWNSKRPGDGKKSTKSGGRKMTGRKSKRR